MEKTDKKMSKKTQMIIAVVLIVIISFYGGMKYGQGKAGATGMPGSTQNRQFTGGTRMGGARGGAGFVNGDIISKDATSITVKDRTGGSKIIFLSGSSQVLKSTSGTLDDLVVGDQITAQGTPNADGSITAQSVQIRPAMKAPVPAQ